jgi:probable HAF family extracellular repeat protein
MKRRVGACLLVACLALLAARAAAAAGYSLLDLGPSTDFAEAINSRGDVVGSGDHAFLYSGGALTFLPTLGAGTFSTALGVNDRDDVVGFSNTPTEAHAFLYHAGAITDLGTLGGGFSLANDVNDAGQVVGTSFDATFRTLPFLYDHGQMRSLGFDGVAAAINASGQIAGLFFVHPPSADPLHAFLFTGGERLDLGTLPGGAESGAEDVNNAGEVVGWSRSATSDERAFLYTGGVMHDLGTLGGSTSHAYAINDLGQVVGTSRDARGFPQAFVWSGGVMRNLNDLVPPIPGGFLWDARGINNRGQIAAYGLVNANFHAFLLTPTR